MNQTLSKAILFLSILTTTGCASMFSAPNQQVTISASNGKPVLVNIKDGSHESKTILPAKIITKADSWNNVSIEVIDKKYDFTRVKIQKRVRPVYWLNVLNLHGFYIDFFTNNMWEYENDVIIPLSNSSNNQSRTINPVEPTPHIFGVGLQSNATAQKNNISHVGKYLSYGYKLTQRNQLNAKYARTVFDCSENDGLIQPDQVCSYRLNVNTKQSALSLSFRHFIDSGGNHVYVGLGIGLVKTKQSVKEINHSVLSDVTYVPFFLEAGLQSKGNLKVNVIGNLSLDKLGLGDNAIISRKYQIDEIENSILKTKAQTQFAAASNYSSLGIGLEWNNKKSKIAPAMFTLGFLLYK